jgi:hypothetical protein
LELAFAVVETVGLVGQEGSLRKGTDHLGGNLATGVDTNQVEHHMACQDNLVQDHLDPIDPAAVGRSVGDMERAEETVEDVEDLEDLGALEGRAVVDWGAEQKSDFDFEEEDEIHSGRYEKCQHAEMRTRNGRERSELDIVIRRKATEISTWGLRSRRT